MLYTTICFSKILHENMPRCCLQSLCCWYFCSVWNLCMPFWKISFLYPILCNIICGLFEGMHRLRERLYLHLICAESCFPCSLSNARGIQVTHPFHTCFVICRKNSSLFNSKPLACHFGIVVSEPVSDRCSPSFSPDSSELLIEELFWESMFHGTTGEPRVAGWSLVVGGAQKGTPVPCTYGEGSMLLSLCEREKVLEPGVVLKVRWKAEMWVLQQFLWRLSLWQQRSLRSATVDGSFQNQPQSAEPPVLLLGPGREVSLLSSMMSPTSVTWRIEVRQLQPRRLCETTMEGMQLEETLNMEQGLDMATKWVQVVPSLHIYVTWLQTCT